MLTEHASTKRWELGVTEDDVLDRIHDGLRAADSGVGPEEAQWVMRRLAELLDWRASRWYPQPEGSTEQIRAHDR